MRNFTMKINSFCSVNCCIRFPEYRQSSIRHTFCQINGFEENRKFNVIDVGSTWVGSSSLGITWQNSCNLFLSIFVVNELYCPYMGIGEWHPNANAGAVYPCKCNTETLYCIDTRSNGASAFFLHFYLRFFFCSSRYLRNEIVEKRRFIFLHRILLLSHDDSSMMCSCAFALVNDVLRTNYSPIFSALVLSVS